MKRQLISSSLIMSSTNMPPFLLILIFLIIVSAATITASSTKNFLQEQPTFPSSTISAAPSLLPDSPLASPSPAGAPDNNDITPLFPSPGGSELSPTESSLPTIPSSPSPPNPDAMSSPGPVMAFSPFGSLPLSSSSLNLLAVSGLPRLVTVMMMGLSGFWFL